MHHPWQTAAARVNPSTGDWRSCRPRGLPRCPVPWNGSQVTGIGLRGLPQVCPEWFQIPCCTPASSGSQVGGLPPRERGPRPLPHAFGKAGTWHGHRADAFDGRDKGNGNDAIRRPGPDQREPGERKDRPGTSASDPRHGRRRPRQDAQATELRRPASGRTSEIRIPVAEKDGGRASFPGIRPGSAGSWIFPFATMAMVMRRWTSTAFSETSPSVSIMMRQGGIPSSCRIFRFAGSGRAGRLSSCRK